MDLESLKRNFKGLPFPQPLEKLFKFSDDLGSFFAGSFELFFLPDFAEWIDKIMSE